MIEEIMRYSQKPILYQSSTSKFWDDEHIAKKMLEAHLNPHLDSATRKHDFVVASADWIARKISPVHYGKLLDLGCGPGIYAEEFFKKGYRITAMDLSASSISYAQDSAKKKNLDIKYICGDYLNMEYEDQFDVITLIYCDFGALSPENRERLMKNMFKALKSGGKLVLDIFTPKRYENRPETKVWSCNEGDFWTSRPHICLESFYRYDECNTFLEQYIVLTDGLVNCYNIWDHAFTVAEIEGDFERTGFKKTEIYADIAGKEYFPETTTLCLVTEKP